MLHLKRCMKDEDACAVFVCSNHNVGCTVYSRCGVVHGPNKEPLQKYEDTIGIYILEVKNIKRNIHIALEV